MALPFTATAQMSDYDGTQGTSGYARRRAIIQQTRISGQDWSANKSRVGGSSAVRAFMPPQPIRPKPVTVAANGPMRLTLRPLAPGGAMVTPEYVDGSSSFTPPPPLPSDASLADAAPAAGGLRPRYITSDAAALAAPPPANDMPLYAIPAAAPAPAPQPVDVPVVTAMLTTPTVAAAPAPTPVEAIAPAVDQPAALPAPRVVASADISPTPAELPSTDILTGSSDDLAGLRARPTAPSGTALAPAPALPALNGGKVAVDPMEANPPPAQPAYSYKPDTPYAAVPVVEPGKPEPFKVEPGVTTGPGTADPAPSAAESAAVVTNATIRRHDEDAKFFTPEDRNEPLPPGTVLPPGAVPPGAVVAAGAPVETAPAHSETLTPESQAILSGLPGRITPAEKPVKPGKLNYNRAAEIVDPLPRTPRITPRTEKGLSISVNEPKFDSNLELEKAYNALLGGDTEGAIRIYQGILDANPNDKAALFGLATTYHRIGMIEQARPLYGKLLKLDPYNVEALNNFFALLGTEAPRAAIEQLDALRHENPDFAPVPAQIGLLYQKLGEYDQAVRYMSQASEISPENLAYRYNLAIICDQGGFKDKAITLYRDLLEADRLGQNLPAPRASIQERLTFLASN